jgi:hypothetical protein
MEFTDVILRVFPLALAGAISPFNVSVVIVMLLSKNHPAARSLVFVAGFTASLVIIGTIAVGIISSIYTPPLRPRTYVIIAGLGLLLVVLGVRQIITKEDPDQPPSAWLEKIESFGIFAAFWIGFFMSMFGLKTLGIYVACLGVITAAEPPLPQMVAEIIIVVVTIISTMLIPILIYISFPERGPDTLHRIKDWMVNRQHIVAGAVLAIAGAALMFYGITGLL